MAVYSSRCSSVNNTNMLCAEYFDDPSYYLIGESYVIEGVEAVNMTLSTSRSHQIQFTVQENNNNNLMAFYNNQEALFYYQPGVVVNGNCHPLLLSTSVGLSFHEGYSPLQIQVTD